jgi:hypothetical protein
MIKAQTAARHASLLRAGLAGGPSMPSDGKSVRWASSAVNGSREGVRCAPVADRNDIARKALANMETVARR